MNGEIKLFLDTNVILHLLGGDKTLEQVLFEKYFYISFVTEMELFSYHGITETEQKSLEEFITTNCKIVNMNSMIKKTAIELRKEYRTKLPDSIILASADYLGIPLITSDKALNKVEEVSTIIYKPS